MTKVIFIAKAKQPWPDYIMKAFQGYKVPVFNETHLNGFLSIAAWLVNLSRIKTILYALE